MTEIKNQQFETERALYASRDLVVTDSIFSGKTDGESPLKESTNIKVINSKFDLRYPFWHDTNLVLENVEMSNLSRAALWYSNGITITNSKLNGIKALRESKYIDIDNTEIDSPEFMWKCRYINISNSSLISEYPFFMSKNIQLDNFTLKGKYSFQYVSDMVIINSKLDTKDAFWHSKNVTVVNSVVKGEYLGWYSKNLKLINCKIIGTQPLCYAKGLVLENCEMIDCDFAFEYSSLKATITNEIISVKNPLKGYIKASSIKEIIIDENIKKNKCKIETKKS